MQKISYKDNRECSPHSKRKHQICLFVLNSRSGPPNFNGQFTRHQLQEVKKEKEGERGLSTDVRDDSRGDKEIDIWRGQKNFKVEVTYSHLTLNTLQKIVLSCCSSFLASGLESSASKKLIQCKCKLNVVE